MLRKLKASLAAAALVFLSVTLAGTSANATVMFEVTAATITPGPGYEQPDVSPFCGSILFLCVDFNDTFAGPASATLAPATSFSFVIGTVLLNDTDRDGGGLQTWIDAGELDGLGATATFTFTDPLGIIQVVTATGVAVAGNINDGPVDLTITWTPESVAFGVGGLFSIAINTVSFDANGQTRTLTATVRLVTEPAAAAIPEPGTLALFGFGLLGMVALRRRGRVA